VCENYFISLDGPKLFSPNTHAPSGSMGTVDKESYERREKV
jgi:hypothetical protein